MHIGLMMECDYRAGKTQEEAFHEAFSTAAHAEEWGFDGVWLAERHFAPQKVGEPYLRRGVPLDHRHRYRRQNDPYPGRDGGAGAASRPSRAHGGGGRDPGPHQPGAPGPGHRP